MSRPFASSVCEYSPMNIRTTPIKKSILLIYHIYPLPSTLFPFCHNLVNLWHKKVRLSLDSRTFCQSGCQWEINPKTVTIINKNAANSPLQTQNRRQKNQSDQRLRSKDQDNTLPMTHHPISIQAHQLTPKRSPMAKCRHNQSGMTARSNRLNWNLPTWNLRLTVNAITKIITAPTDQNHHCISLPLCSSS